MLNQIGLDHFPSAHEHTDIALKESVDTCSFHQDVSMELNTLGYS